MIYTARYFLPYGYIWVMDYRGDYVGAEIPAKSREEAVKALEDKGYVIINTFDQLASDIIDFQVELEE